MAAAFYRAVRETARREVPLLAAGNTTARQAARLQPSNNCST
ncbi:hypothetical protein [Streptomyces sp900116325]